MKINTTITCLPQRSTDDIGLKSAPCGTADRLLTRGKIRLEHPKF